MLLKPRPQSWNWIQKNGFPYFQRGQDALCCNVFGWLLSGFYKDSRPIGSEAYQTIHQAWKSWKSWKLSSRWSLRHLLCCETADTYPSKEFSAHHLPLPAISAASNSTSAFMKANGQCTLYMTDSKWFEINRCFKSGWASFPNMWLHFIDRRNCISWKSSSKEQPTPQMYGLNSVRSTPPWSTSSSILFKHQRTANLRRWSRV